LLSALPSGSKEANEYSEPEAEKSVKVIMKQIFDAIAHAHSKGVAHNDIKGDNIIIGTAEKSTVIDFGESTTEKMVKKIDVAGGIRGPGKLVQTLVDDRSEG
jgi:serine/threonine protein kinase